jgi:diguanylate cyclase (GGDEF)-like protein
MLFFSAPTSCVVRANRAACRLLGYAQHQLQSMRLAAIAPQVRASNLAQLCERAARSVDQEATIRTVYRHQTRALLPVDCTIRRVASLPEDIFVAVASERFHQPGDLRPRIGNAQRDGLTGLPDRNWLWQQLEQECSMARQDGGRLAVLFVDIDRFKLINDTHGHLAGDEVLQTLARRLAECVRPNDVVARCGGDEFVVMLKGVRSSSDVRGIVERIGGGFEAKGTLRGGTEWRAPVTVSIGVAISGGEDSSSVDLFERADRAMYQAKALGRAGRFVVDDSSAARSQST